MANKKITNDQQHIIEAIIRKDKAYVWESVKYIGIDDERDMNNRFIIFQRAYHDFDPKKNNNFIYFYKKYLKYLRLSKNNTFYLTENPSVIQRLKNENISPSEKNTKLVEDLKKWEL